MIANSISIPTSTPTLNSQLYFYYYNTSAISSLWLIPLVPLAIFKREKEIARRLEFDGLYIAEQPEDDDIKVKSAMHYLSIFLEEIQWTNSIGIQFWIPSSLTKRVDIFRYVNVDVTHMLRSLNTI